jgi:pilus assembly protein CpaF
VFGKRSTSAPDGAVKAPAAPVKSVAAAPPLQPALEPASSPAPKATNVVEGGRSPIPSVGLGAPLVTAPTAGRQASSGPPPQVAPTATDSRHTDAYYDTKGAIFGALIEAIDLGQLAKLDAPIRRARKFATSSTRSSRSRTS